MCSQINAGTAKVVDPLFYGPQNAQSLAIYKQEAAVQDRGFKMNLIEDGSTSNDHKF